MREILPKKLIELAKNCPFPLYVVGGSVRDYLAHVPCRGDWDICSPADEAALIAAANKSGFTASAVYKRTGTVKLKDGEGGSCEFTRFRTDLYVRGNHSPSQIFFTDDIGKDARRRDFCANAVYYDIGREVFCDPLGGKEDISQKKLRTVAPAKKVFGEDGLRLMRLARIAAQTGFSPDEECLAGAKENAALIQDIVPERIFAELSLILASDERLGDKTAPYRGLRILKEIGVLSRILPELALGDGMAQRADFHKYDVLEHSLRCVLYAPKEVRFAALLHDVGKPFCMERDGNFHAHAEEGARIAEEILTRLKAPAKLVEETKALVALHMRDFDLKMRENKVRREVVKNYPLLPALYALKQADFSACRDDLSPAPSVLKWKSIQSRMEEEGVPFTLSLLAVNGNDLHSLGVPPQRTGEVLHELLFYCAENGARNSREGLLARVSKLYGEK